MNFAVWNKTPSQREEFIGAAITVTCPKREMTHAGIVHGRAGQKPMLLHFATDRKLLNEEMSGHGSFNWDSCRWIDVDDDREDYLFLLRYFDTMARRPDALRYRPKAPDDQFDGAGNPVPTADDEGVTCATFIALAFKGARLPIVDLATWKSRDGDREWQEFVYWVLRNKGIGKLPEETVPWRLKPCEVVSAAVQEDVPVNFERAKSLSVPLLAILFPAPPEEVTPPVDEASPTRGDPNAGRSKDGPDGAQGDRM